MAVFGSPSRLATSRVASSAAARPIAATTVLHATWANPGATEALVDVAGDPPLRSRPPVGATRGGWL